LVFQILSGALPYRGSSLPEWIRCVVEAPAPPLSQVVPEVTQELEQLAARLLSKEPAPRPGAVEARASLEAMQRVLGVHGATFRPPPVTRAPKPAVGVPAPSPDAAPVAGTGGSAGAPAARPPRSTGSMRRPEPGAALDGAADLPRARTAGAPRRTTSM